MSNKNINIDNLIDLASFMISPDEKEILEKEIEDFLEYAEVINSAPTKGLQPSSHAIDKDVLYREDNQSRWEHLDAMLSNAPHIDNTSYIVPPLKGQTGTEKDVDENNEPLYHLVEVNPIDVDDFLDLYTEQKAI